MEVTLTTCLSKAEFDLFQLIGGDTPHNRNSFLDDMLHDALARRVKWMQAFNSRIDRNGPIPPNHMTSCWLWTGGKIPSGYGVAHHPVTKTATLAHRLSYELARGPIPENMILLHSCDTPLCVNPDHHAIGTHKQNTADMYAKDRQNAEKHRLSVQRVRRAKLTPAQVAEIRVLKTTKGATYSELANLFGVTVPSIGNIFRGKTWKS